MPISSHRTCRWSFVLLVLLSFSVAQAGTLTVSNLPYSSGFGQTFGDPFSVGSLDIATPFSFPEEVLLLKVTLWIEALAPSSHPVEVAIWSDSSNAPGVKLASSIFPLAQFAGYEPQSLTGLLLSGGQQYWLSVSLLNALAGEYASWRNSTNPGTGLVAEHLAGFDADGVWRTRTYIPGAFALEGETTVPEPGTGYAIVLGLLTLRAVLRKKNR